MNFPLKPCQPVINPYHCQVFRYVVSLGFLFICCIAHSAIVDFTPSCQRAYTSILSLRLAEARVILQAERARESGNRIVEYLENYLDFFEIMGKDDPVMYANLWDQFDNRLLRLEQIPENNPWSCFLRAECHTQWAIMHFRMGQYARGVWSLRKAYFLLHENRERFPDFRMQKKTEGVVEILLGAVPDGYQWALNILGMEGRLAKGISDLKGLAEDRSYFYRMECELMYALLMMNLSGQKEEARLYLENRQHPIPGNLLSHYVYAFLCVQSFHADQAVQTIYAAPKGEEYPVFPYLNYLLGLAKTYRSDGDAGIYLRRFIQQQEGRNHVRSAWQKLGWNLLLKGDSTGYKSAMKQVLRQGRNNLDQDRQATMEARLGKIPNVSLLKARLLFDGGFFRQALDTLQRIQIHLFSDPEVITEFHYRKGKVLQAMKQNTQAAYAYQMAVQNGKQLNRYFAAYALYELGVIAEGNGQKVLAKQYFSNCLTMPEHEYSAGLVPKVRLAMQRVSR